MRFFDYGLWPPLRMTDHKIRPDRVLVEVIAFVKLSDFSKMLS